MSTKYTAPVQLELSLFGDRSLRSAVMSYMAMCTDGLSDATLKDYADRGAWCLREFGDLTDIATVDYDEFDRVIRRNQMTLKHVTLKKRLVFLRACLKLAKRRKLLGEVPEVPRLQDDSERKTDLHTVAQWQIARQLLPAGPFRRFYDLGFWTGHHLADLFTMERWMLDPAREVVNGAGQVVAKGMFLRRNTKNRKHKIAPVWIPMQPELKLVLPEILEGVRPNETGLVIGRIWNVRRTLHVACDRALAAGHDIPRVSPIDLRRSFGSMMAERHYSLHFIRIALGHLGEREPSGRTAKPTTATRHYLHATPELISSGVART